MKEVHTIVCVHITDRAGEAGKVQQLLTEYGSQIRTRLGLHNVDNNSDPSGLIVLEMVQPESGIGEMTDKLNQITGVEAKTLTFHHPAP